MLERTLALIKPDAVMYYLAEISSLIEEENFTIVTKKKCCLTKTQARIFYQEHEGKSFFNNLCSFTASGTLCALILEGDGAVKRWRDLVGDTDPKKAAPGTIRSQFGKGMPNNAVHGSADLEAARREINFFFAGMELVK